MPEEYVSYLLRLWKKEHRQGPVWRASLEDVRTRERVYLDMDGLLRFLQGHFAESGPDEASIREEREEDGC